MDGWMAVHYTKGPPRWAVPWASSIIHISLVNCFLEQIFLEQVLSGRGQTQKGEEVSIQEGLGPTDCWHISQSLPPS